MTAAPPAAGPPEEPASSPPDAPFWRPVLLVWLMMSGLALYAARGAIAAGYPAGPDDLLRMVEVRDWLAGQPWTDVSQHRIGLPGTLSMHWSRLVDLPVAGIMTGLTPIIGAVRGQLAALIAVPLFTALVILALGTHLVRRFVPDGNSALMAPLFVAATPLVAIQTWPMRIDHHGWQVAASLAAVTAIFGAARVRAGLLSGTAAALGLAVAVEGLPLALMIGLVLAVRTLQDEREGGRLIAYAGALAAAAASLFALTQPAFMWSAAWCDALMPAYFAAFAAAAVILSVLKLPAVRSASARAGVMALAGIGAGAALLSINPACAAGPFAALDPQVAEIWYQSVREGLPLWHASGTIITLVAAQLLIGGAGYALAIMRARGDCRTGWLCMAALFAGAALVGIIVMRASATATVLALPGTIYLLSDLLPRASRVRPPRRVLAIAAVIFALFPLSPLLLAGAAKTDGDAAEPVSEAGPAEGDCTAPPAMAALAGLPAADILAPLDMAPAILYAAPHRVVASAHHRGNVAIADTIRAFMGSAAQARGIAAQRGVRYLAFCAEMNEVRRYAARAPNGLAGRLSHGAVPDWLTPVPIAGPVQLYEINR